MSSLPHLSTDQVAAFVELSRVGQIRAAANALGITEQGVRNRLIALETQLGIELYRKVRGPRLSAVLTPHGRRFLPHALAYVADREGHVGDVLPGQGIKQFQSSGEASHPGGSGDSDEAHSSQYLHGVPDVAGLRTARLS